MLLVIFLPSTNEGFCEHDDQIMEGLDLPEIKTTRVGTYEFFFQKDGEDRLIT